VIPAKSPVTSLARTTSTERLALEKRTANPVLNDDNTPLFPADLAQDKWLASGTASGLYSDLG
jgi:hypothetical protein